MVCHSLGIFAGIAPQLHCSCAASIQVLDIVHQERGVPKNVLLDGSHHICVDGAVLCENSQYLLRNPVVLYLPTQLYDSLTTHTSKSRHTDAASNIPPQTLR